MGGVKSLPTYLRVPKDDVLVHTQLLKCFILYTPRGEGRPGYEAMIHGVLLYSMIHILKF